MEVPVSCPPCLRPSNPSEAVSVSVSVRLCNPQSPELSRRVRLPVPASATATQVPLIGFATWGCIRGRGALPPSLPLCGACTQFRGRGACRSEGRRL
eukprot:346420-Rhodomonas_salina.4